MTSLGHSQDLSTGNVLEFWVGGEAHCSAHPPSKRLRGCHTKHGLLKLIFSIFVDPFQNINTYIR